MSTSNVVKRSLALDTAVVCDKVIRFLGARDPGSIIAGAARLIGRSEKKGRIVLVFASSKYGELRVQVDTEVGPDRLDYILRGDLHGSVRLTGISRMGGCRVYMEAEGEGKLIEEYGGDALSRILNRMVITIVSAFPAILLPQVPGGRFGDYFIELLELVNLAEEGNVKLSGTIRSIALDLEKARVINAEGIGEEEALAFARPFSDVFKRLSEALKALGEGQPLRLVVSGERNIIVANMAGNLSVVTLLQRLKPEEALKVEVTS